MKNHFFYLFFFLIVFLFVFGCATTPKPPSEPMKIQKVIEINKNKEELYKLSSEVNGWLRHLNLQRKLYSIRIKNKA